MPMSPINGLEDLTRLIAGPAAEDTPEVYKEALHRISEASDYHPGVRAEAARLFNRLTLHELRTQVDQLTRELLDARKSLVYERSSRIIPDLYVALRDVNAQRAKAGLEPIPWEWGELPLVE